MGINKTQLPLATALAITPTMVYELDSRLANNCGCRSFNGGRKRFKHNRRKQIKRNNRGS